MEPGYYDDFESENGYCFTCQNLGTIECECGGDLCICGIGDELPCPGCHPAEYRAVFIGDEND